VTVAEAARIVADYHQAPEPELTGQFREGDVRWAVAATDALERHLGVVPAVPFEDGVVRVGEWLFRGA